MCSKRAVWGVLSRHAGVCCMNIFCWSVTSVSVCFNILSQAQEPGYGWLPSPLPSGSDWTESWYYEYFRRCEESCDAKGHPSSSLHRCSIIICHTPLGLAASVKWTASKPTVVELKLGLGITDMWVRWNMAAVHACLQSSLKWLS